MLTLRNEYSTFSRKADQKIALLKEVLDKVQRGEQVDVEKVLGTGDEKQEQEWKDGELPVDTLRSACQSYTTSSHHRYRAGRSVGIKGPKAREEAPKERGGSVSSIGDSCPDA